MDNKAKLLIGIMILISGSLMIDQITAATIGANASLNGTSGPHPVCTEVIPQKLTKTTTDYPATPDHDAFKVVSWGVAACYTTPPGGKPAPTKFGSPTSWQSVKCTKSKSGEQCGGKGDVIKCGAPNICRLADSGVAITDGYDQPVSPPANFQIPNCYALVCGTATDGKHLGIYVQGDTTFLTSSLIKGPCAADGTHLTQNICGTDGDGYPSIVRDTDLITCPVICQTSRTDPSHGACNPICNTDNDCRSNVDGFTSCVPTQGGGKVCQ